MDPVAVVRRSSLWPELGTALRRLAVPWVAVAVGILLLGLLITQVLAHGLLANEAVVNRELAQDRTATGNTVTRAFSSLSDANTVIALTTAAVLGCRIAFRRWREAVYVMLAVTGESLIFLLTTLLIERARPPVPLLDGGPPTSSYPSGHVAAAVACYGSLAAIVLWRSRHALLRAAAVAVAVGVPLLVAVSRLYRGMHFPSDVVAGLLLGTAWLAATTRQVLVLQPVRSADSRSPTASRQAAS
jgi:undecaprenyl-diphosphatase